MVTIPTESTNVLRDYILQKRHRADDETNHREVEIFREGMWQPVKWQDLSVGDIVKVYNNHFFPADLILLSSRYRISRSFR